MKDLSIPIKKAAESFTILGVALQKTEETFKELAALLNKVDDRNFKKHNEACNMVARLMRKSTQIKTA